MKNEIKNSLYRYYLFISVFYLNTSGKIFATSSYDSEQSDVTDQDNKKNSSNFVSLPASAAVWLIVLVGYYFFYDNNDSSPAFSETQLGAEYSDNLQKRQDIIQREKKVSPLDTEVKNNKPERVEKKTGKIERKKSKQNKEFRLIEENSNPLKLNEFFKKINYNELGLDSKELINTIFDKLEEGGISLVKRYTDRGYFLNDYEVLWVLKHDNLALTQDDYFDLLLALVTILKNSYKETDVANTLNYRGIKGDKKNCFDIIVTDQEVVSLFLDSIYKKKKWIKFVEELFSCGYIVKQSEETLNELLLKNELQIFKEENKCRLVHI